MCAWRTPAAWAASPWWTTAWALPPRTGRASSRSSSARSRRVSSEGWASASGFPGRSSKPTVGASPWGRPRVGAPPSRSSFPWPRDGTTALQVAGHLLRAHPLVELLGGEQAQLHGGLLERLALL